MSPTYCIIPTSSSSCSRPFSFEWKHIILLTGGLLPHAARCQVDQLQLTKIPQKITVKIHIEPSVTVFCQFKFPLFVTWNKIPFCLVTEINIWEMICLAIYICATHRSDHSPFHSSELSCEYLRRTSGITVPSFLVLIFTTFVIE